LTELPVGPLGIDRVVMTGDNDFNLASSDQNVAAGGTLTIDAQPLGAGHHVQFDGSAETNGSFVFFGGPGDDIFIGGAGDDRIAGGHGSDRLTGGGGADTFVYSGAGDSTGHGYDTILDFNPASDHIDLPTEVTGFAAPVGHGSLSTATIDGDLSAVMTGLGAHQAAWFAPDAGDLAGKIFLIVDANGIAGYQPGEDYVIAVAGAPLADLTSHTGIFV
jgi:Ca2+-binding RTX toxin-like protein